MIDVIAIVCSRILADTPLLALLCELDSEAAVYEEGQVPAEFPYQKKPLIIVDPPTHLGNTDTFDTKYRNEQIDIRLYHKPEGSSEPLTTAAETLRELFENWGPSAVNGGQVVNTTVLGPLPGPTQDPTLGGRVLRVSLLIKET